MTLSSLVLPHDYLSFCSRKVYGVAFAGKIEVRKQKESAVLDHRQQRSSINSGIEDFCETFERTVKPVVVSTPSHTIEYAITVKYSRRCL